MKVRHEKNSRKGFVLFGWLLAGMAVLLAVAFISRQNVDEDLKWLERPADSLSIRRTFDASPPLSADESLERMVVEDGFKVDLVAAEPLVVAPVAMTFDYSGRMWVVEMTGYMPDTIGTGEDRPSGKIAILEDSDADGRADTRKEFLDSLVLPRAIALVENGVLVAEPPILWFVENNNDQPGKRYVVDSAYTQGGNAEHQPNGLIRGLDNWIYNANSRKRYRKQDDKWLIERTHFRGQWGISHDNAGRMFYNNNSANLLGDYFPPSLGAWNEHQREVSGFSETIIADERVYPSRPTMGVNRGYRRGTLDAWMRLRNVTAACSPLVYRGGLFGESFDQNVFVAEPAANLVKRNIVSVSGYEVTGRQAYEGREFLASTDERFRPVSLYNGPDGALYIVDMYRGIIEHKTYLTDYLQKEIEMRDLTQPLDLGRIYRIAPEGKSGSRTVIRRDPEELIKMTTHPNGWVRDKAQQMIVESQMRELVPQLKQMIKKSADPIATIHALWTLEGLRALQPEDVIPLLNSERWAVKMNAFAAISATVSRDNFRQHANVIERMVGSSDSVSAPLVAYAVMAIEPYDKRQASDLLIKITRRFPDDQVVADAVISNLENRETAFLRLAAADTSRVINRRLRDVLADMRSSELKKKSGMLAKKYPEGYALYNNVCQACHAADGNGVKAVAPPLNGSEWVTGDKDKLASIVLFGLTGPVKVNGKVYAGGEMPGISANAAVTDKDLAELLSFIRASWGNAAGAVSPADVGAIRKRHSGRQQLFTVDELNR